MEVASVEGDGTPEVLRSRYVVWAAGEFQYPAASDAPPVFPGADLCRHNSVRGGSSTSDPTLDPSSDGTLDP